MSKKVVHFLFLLIFGFNHWVLGSGMMTPLQKDEIEKLEIALHDFYLNPKSAMDLIPPKKTISGKKLPTLFSEIEITDGSFVEKKRMVDKKQIKQIDPVTGVEVSLEELIEGKAAPLSYDQAENLVTLPADKEFIKNIYEIEKKSLQSVTLKNVPWSDSYWPIYMGGLSARYADPSFPKNNDWKINYDYFFSKNYEDYLTNASSLETLSPAEKYDLFIGDKNFTLSKEQWENGQYYYQSQNQKVEKWMGHCHGWAPASYMMDRPVSPIEVLAADGKTKLKFYPQDIKALATLLWSNSKTNKKFIGGRCNVKKPEKDDSTGRILNDSCFDSNPRSWHLSVINQIGVAGKSFVMDATYDYEVWNHPVFAYSFSYFNPETRTYSENIKDALVLKENFKSDLFAKHRSPQAHSFLGISMKVNYVVEHHAAHKDQNDSIVQANYLYDLELDADGEIIGGEWYQNAHPDFLWTPLANEKALSTVEKNPTAQKIFEKDIWKTKKSIPESWQKLGVMASLENQPISKIVEEFIMLSRLNLK